MCLFNLSKNLPYSNVKKSRKWPNQPVVGCHTWKQWVEQNSIHKDGNYGLKSCTQHKEVSIMIDLISLKPFHLWSGSLGSVTESTPHPYHFPLKEEEETKLSCRVKEIRWLWTVSHSLHIISRGHLNKELGPVQWDSLKNKNRWNIHIQTTPLNSQARQRRYRRDWNITPSSMIFFRRDLSTFTGSEKVLCF